MAHRFDNKDLILVEIGGAQAPVNFQNSISKCAGLQYDANAPNVR